MWICQLIRAIRETVREFDILMLDGKIVQHDLTKEDMSKKIGENLKIEIDRNKSWIFKEEKI